jgi:hypothetical protein
VTRRAEAGTVGETGRGFVSVHEPPFPEQAPRPRRYEDGGKAAADVDLALGALELAWACIYDISYAEGEFRARRRDGRGGTLSGLTPDAITAEMRADWGDGMMA